MCEAKRISVDIFTVAVPTPYSIAIGCILALAFRYRMLNVFIFECPTKVVAKVLRFSGLISRCTPLATI